MGSGLLFPVTLHNNLPPTKEVNVFACVCLSVCLSVRKITQKRVHGFGWNVACRQNVGTWTNWLTFEPDPDYSPDCFLRYAAAATQNFTSGKSHVQTDMPSLTHLAWDSRIFTPAKILFHAFSVKLRIILYANFLQIFKLYCIKMPNAKHDFCPLFIFCRLCGP